jgi:hypothetical protein
MKVATIEQRVPGSDDEGHGFEVEVLEGEPHHRCGIRHAADDEIGLARSKQGQKVVR